MDDDLQWNNSPHARIWYLCIQYCIHRNICLGYFNGQRFIRSCCVYSEEKQCPLLPASLTLSCQIETLFQVLLLFTVWRHSVSMAYQPLVQVSHWAVEWQDLWNNSDRFDPHFQHNGLSVSWFHQGHHSTVVALLPMMDHCWAGFLSKPVSFNRNMSYPVNAVSSCRAVGVWLNLLILDQKQKNVIAKI